MYITYIYIHKSILLSCKSIPAEQGNYDRKRHMFPFGGLLWWFLFGSPSGIPACTEKQRTESTLKYVSEMILL